MFPSSPSSAARSARSASSSTPSGCEAYQASAFQIMGMLQQANVVIPSGSFPAGNREIIVETGSFLKDAEDVGAPGGPCL